MLSLDELGRELASFSKSLLLYAELSFRWGAVLVMCVRVSIKKAVVLLTLEKLRRRRYLAAHQAGCRIAIE
jgi:aspartate/tyrosine/aromatic aminotransferase